MALNLNCTFLLNPSHIVWVNLFLLEWMLLAKFSCMLFEMRTIFKHLNGSFWVYESIVVLTDFIFWQKRNYWEDNLNWSKSWTELIRKNVHTYLAFFKVNIRVPNLVQECAFWRSKRVIFRPLKFDSKPITFIWTV